MSLIVRPINNLRMLLSACLCIILCLIAVGCGDYKYKGVIREDPPVVSSYSIPTISGDTFGFKPEQHNLLLVYFGYTFCPDICPTTLADIRAAREDIGNKKSSQVTTIFITVDPKRDTEESLRQYLSRFDENAIGLRTTDETKLQEIALAFGASYKIGDTSKENYDVLHSTWLYAVNSEGQLITQWQFGTSSKDLSQDISHLLDSTKYTP